jgi:hypothetical protein
MTANPRPTGGRSRAWLLAAALGLLPGAAEAGRYVLEEGGRYELCREFAAALAEARSFAPDTWEWPVSPRFPDFRKPRWEVLDPVKERDLTLRLGHDRLAAKQQSPEVLEGNERLFRQTLEEGFSKGEVRLERTRVDLDHNGTTETLYRVRLVQGNAWGFYLDSTEDPDLASRYHRRALTSGVDALLHRGRFYLIVNHVPDLSVVETQRVGPLNELAAIPVCEFDYRQD